MNRDLVSQILSGRRWPTVKQLDSLVRVLASAGVHVPGEAEESSRFIDLWTAAEEPFKEQETPRYSRDPVDRAFEEASASGHVAPILELSLNSPPVFVVEVLEKLAARNWGNFTNELLRGLADNLDSSRIPALSALLPISKNSRPSSRPILLKRFGESRPISDVCHLAILARQAGAGWDAKTLIATVREKRSLADAAQLFVALYKAGHDWEVTPSCAASEVWPNSPEDFLRLVHEFHSLDCSEAVPTLVARYGWGHGSIFRWDLYSRLSEQDIWDTRKVLIQALMEKVPEGEVAEFVSIAASRGDFELSSRIVRGVIFCRSDSSYFIRNIPPELEAIASEAQDIKSNGIRVSSCTSPVPD
ncbi:hypothetical protein ACGFN1_13040 [Streptomyces sp. NPDC048685]|uniref:hypothetical protein n=1 Tax=Streptomyces sp. NPDC048685 TaxID=3365584 RepID=UPI0037165A9A